MARLITFIAVPLPENIKQQIANLQNRLEEKNLPISWSNPERAHITLVYLGRISQTRVEAAAKAVSETTENYYQFELGIGEIGYFQKEKRTLRQAPGQAVIWLQVHDPEKRVLKKLYKVLFEKLTTENFYPPRRLSAHITIGRVKKQRSKPQLQAILTQVANHQTNLRDSFVADRINLYESIQNDNRHHLLRSYFLRMRK